MGTNYSIACFLHTEGYSLETGEKTKMIPAETGSTCFAYIGALKCRRLRVCMQCSVAAGAPMPGLIGTEMAMQLKGNILRAAVCWEIFPEAKEVLSGATTF